MSNEASVGVAILTLLLGVSSGVIWARKRASAASYAVAAIQQRILYAAVREAKASSEELDQFAYIASHDLRAPLRAVANLAGFLQEDLAGKVPEESAKHLDMILQRVARLDAAILGLLAYSRVSRDDEAAVLSDIDALIRRSVSEHTTARTTLVFTDSGLTFPVAPKRFVQTLGLVFSNAEAHHDKDSVELQVSAELKHDRLYVSIADDGPGIEPQYHARVFELFSTLRARDDVEASGLGLAILAKTLRHLGGKVSLHSDPSTERGASLLIEWPAEALHESQANP